MLTFSGTRETSSSEDLSQERKTNDETLVSQQENSNALSEQTTFEEKIKSDNEAGLTNNKDYVIVSVWGPSAKVQKDGSTLVIRPSSFGHVLLETHVFLEAGTEKIEYISYWPGACRQNNSERRDLCQEDKPHFHDKNMDDVIYADPKKNQTVILTSLNIQHINTTYQDFRNGKHSWKLWGSNLLFRSPYERNCSGLTFDLLKAGGLTKLAKSHQKNDYTRLLSILALSSLFIGVVCYLSYRQIKPTAKVINDYDLYRKGYTFSVAASISAQKKVNEISNRCTDIMNKALEMNNQPIYENALAARDQAYKAIELLEGVKKTGMPLAFKLDRLAAFVSNKVRLASFVGFSIGGISSLLIYLNKKLILETMTPSDVFELAQKAKRTELKFVDNSKPISLPTTADIVKNNSGKIAMAVAGLAGCGLYFYFNKTKNSNSIPVISGLSENINKVSPNILGRK